MHFEIRHSDYILSITNEFAVPTYGCYGIFCSHDFGARGMFPLFHSTGSYTRRRRICKSWLPWSWTRTKIIGSSNLSTSAGFDFQRWSWLYVTCDRRWTKNGWSCIGCSRLSLETWIDDVNVLEMLGGEPKLEIKSWAKISRWYWLLPLASLCVSNNDTWVAFYSSIIASLDYERSFIA